MADIGAPNAVTEAVVEIVKEHMVTVGPSTKRKARRLLSRLKHASVEDLFKVIEADQNGRPPLPQNGLSESGHLLKQFCLEVEGEIKPIVMGRHLIQLGMEPGPEFGPILKEAYEAQLDGKFTTLDEGLMLVLRGIEDG